MTMSPVLNVWQPASLLCKLWILDGGEQNCMLNFIVSNDLNDGDSIAISHLHLYFWRKPVTMWSYCCCCCLDYDSYCADCWFEFYCSDNCTNSICIVKWTNSFKHFCWILLKRKAIDYGRIYIPLRFTFNKLETVRVWAAWIRLSVRIIQRRNNLWMKKIILLNRWFWLGSFSF